MMRIRFANQVNERKYDKIEKNEIIFDFAGIDNAVPNPIQAKFICDLTAYICGLIGGVGSGKTDALVTKHVLLSVINSTGKLTRDSIQSAYILPTYTMIVDIAEPVFFRIFRWLSERGCELLEDWRACEHKFLLTVGHQILLRSSDRPQKLHGPNLSHVSADEICRWEDPVGYDIARERVRDPRAKILQFNYATSPEEGHWVKSVICDKGRKIERNEKVQTRVETNRWYHMTQFDNPALSDYKKQVSKESMSERAYRQMVLGEWLSAEGVVFAEFDKRVHMIDFPRRKGMLVSIGIDPGEVYPAVVVITQMSERGVWCVIDEVIRDRVSFRHILDLLLQKINANNWKINNIVIDPNDAQLEYYIYEIVKVLKTYPKYDTSMGFRSARIGRELLHLLLRDKEGKVRLYFAKHLETERNERNLGSDERGIIESIERYKYPMRKYGLGEKPAKTIHAHAMDALRYVCMWEFPSMLRNVAAMLRNAM